MYERIPKELQILNQWVNWRYEDKGGKKPTKIPYNPKNAKKADVTDSLTWGSFAEALTYLEHNPNMADGIGFVFTDEDPYAFIDFDAPEDMSPEEMQKVYDRQMELFREFDSYSERSPSGNGLHIIVKGKILSGRRRSCIEIYSSERYATFTGNVFRESPIAERNELLNILYKRMGEGRNNSTAGGFYANAPQTEEDAEVIVHASSAANGEKFDALHTGRWQEYYQSQSEADFAYVDIIAFYTQNREQVSRIFRNSALGQRDKAKRDDYVNYMLNRCFDRMLPPVDIEGLRVQMEEALKRIKEAEQPAEKSYVINRTEPVVNTELQKISESSPYTVPPGLVGDIARFIYEQSPRPVPEISLAGAISLVCGIAGRSYNISGSGINQYILLLAKTGTGKEAMARGIGKLMNEVGKTVPASKDFRGPGSIASPQALLKQFANKPSFLTILGEFGIELQIMSSPHANDNKKGLMRTLLELYHKSGQGDTVQEMVYSEKEKNVAVITAPSLTLLGESTPETFYKALDETMIDSGLMPRFTCIEYHGQRPDLNPDHLEARPSFELIDKLSALCAHSLMLNSQNTAVTVKLDEAAQTMMDSFDRYITDEMRASDRQLKANLWNRVHMKALRLAATVAVGINPYNPIVDTNTASWAINVVLADVKNMLNRFDAGDVGENNEESKRLKEVVRVVREYMMKSWPEVAKYMGNDGVAVFSHKIVPWGYIQRRCVTLAAFKTNAGRPAHATDMVKKTVQILVERGDLAKIDHPTAMEMLGKPVNGYMVAVPRTFEL